MNAPNAIAAIVIAAMPVPVLWLIDYSNSGCGDGLCGTFTGLLALAAPAAASLYFVRRSARGNEAPALLRAVPFVLWLLVLAPLLV